MLSLTPRVVLDILLVLGYVLLLAKLWRSGLFRVYRWFTFYIAYQFCRYAFTAPLAKNTSLYALIYFATEALAWIISALVLFELFNFALEAHAGIRTFGRQVLTGALLVSTLVSVSTLFMNLSRTGAEASVLESYLIIGRVVNLSLLGMLIILIGFLGYFPVPVNRNTMVHAALFSMYFLAKAIILLSRNLLGGEILAQLNLALFIVATACLFVWSYVLTNAAEQRVVRTSRRTNREEEQRLIAQLDEINATLLRSARK